MFTLRGRFRKLVVTAFLASALVATPLVAAHSVPSPLTFSQSTGLPLFYSGTYGVYPNFASSSDGRYVIAAHDYLYRSTNYGASFDTITAVNSPNVSAVWSSTDGSKLLATVYAGQIWKSTNSGSSWTAVGATKNWYAVTASDDGTRIIAAEYNGFIYSSEDSGSTWTARTAVAKGWTSLAADSTATRVYGSADTEWISTNGGVTWASSGLNLGSCCFMISTSADGKNVFLGANGNGFYLSTDYGATMTRQTSITTTSRDAPNVWGYGSGMSRDGTQLVALSLGDYVWISNDTGANWVKQTSLGTDAWAGQASISNDGRVVLGAADYNWWTFSAKTFYYSPAGGATTISIATNTNTKKRASSTITATLSNPGTVTFYENGRVIAGCRAVLTATTTATCNWIPQIQGSKLISAKLVPTDTNYFVSNSSTKTVTIAKRTAAR